jgi:replicative DNA helicase
MLVGIEARTMAQRKPDEQSNFDQVLKLVENLTPEQQDRLVEQIKLQWLRRALAEAEESVAQGRVLTEEELEKRLDAKRREIVERQKQ